MATLVGNLHFWTLKENTLINSASSSIGCYSYHNKGSTNAIPYYDDLKTFCEARGVTWCPSKKRPEKLKENLNNVEELLSSYRVVFCNWRSRNCLQLMLNNGIIIVLRVKAGSGDIEKIVIDKYLVGKLHSDHIVDVIICETSILVSYVEPKLTRIQLQKKIVSVDSNKKWEKLNTLDPKISTIDLLGPTGRRLERRLSCSIQNDQLMIWWMSGSEETIWPWTPISMDRERANIHIYNVSGSEVSLLCHARTKYDPTWATYSRLHLHQIYTVEQQISRKGEITVGMCTYEVAKGSIQCTSVTVIPLGSYIVCQEMNMTEDRVLIGCKDASLVMYDTQRKTTHLTKAAFNPVVIGWHPSGSLVMVGSDKGQIQCFDMALCCLRIDLLRDNPCPQPIFDLSSYIRIQPTFKNLFWNPLEYSPVNSAGYLDSTHSLLILINRGPLALFTFKCGIHNRGLLTAIELVTQYVKCSQFCEAINLLLNLNWNVESELCFKCLAIIFNRLVRMALTDETEAQLETVLGSYYSPTHPLSDVVTLEFHVKVVRLARRFFHLLLRYDRFEKAFLLASDIGAHDLFMDIHYLAKDRGERILAQVSWERAVELEHEADSLSADSQDESDEQQSSLSPDSYSSNDEGSEDSHWSGQLRTSALPSRPVVRDKVTTVNEIVSASKPYAGDAGRSPSSPPDEERNSTTSYRWPAPSVQSQVPSSRPKESDTANQNRTQQPPSSNPTVSSLAIGSHRYNGPVHMMTDISEETSEEEEEGHGTVHVVHFGVV